MESSVAQLVAAAAAQGITLPPVQAAALDHYCRLLWDWNTKINLTRHTDYEKFVGRDLVDTLAFAAVLRPQEKVLDVGTGGGVPGVVLAIVRPDLKVTVTETVAKKVRVVQDIVEKLKLPVRVHHGRAEELLRSEKFGSLVVRAVASLTKLLEWFRPLWQRFDRLLVLKGPSWVEERGEARHLGKLKNVALRVVQRYPIAGTDAESVLLLLCPQDRLAQQLPDKAEEPDDAS